MKHRSARLGQESKPFLTKAWVDSRDIEAGASYAQLLKAHYEAGPSEERGFQTHEAYSATATYIGMGISTSSSVSKAEMVDGAKQCLQDLSLVHGLQEHKIKAGTKKMRKLLEITAHASLAPEATEMPIWLSSSDYRVVYPGTPVSFFKA